MSRRNPAQTRTACFICSKPLNCRGPTTETGSSSGSLVGWKTPPGCQTASAEGCPPASLHQPRPRPCRQRCHFPGSVSLRCCAERARLCHRCRFPRRRSPPVPSWSPKASSRPWGSHESCRRRSHSPGPTAVRYDGGTAAHTPGGSSRSARRPARTVKGAETGTGSRTGTGSSGAFLLVSWGWRAKQAVGWTGCGTARGWRASGAWRCCRDRCPRSKTRAGRTDCAGAGSRAARPSARTSSPGKPAPVGTGTWASWGRTCLPGWPDCALRPSGCRAHSGTYRQRPPPPGCRRKTSRSSRPLPLWSPSTASRLGASSTWLAGAQRSRTSPKHPRSCGIACDEARRLRIGPSRPTRQTCGARRDGDPRVRSVVASAGFLGFFHRLLGSIGTRSTLRWCRCGYRGPWNRSYRFDSSLVTGGLNLLTLSVKPADSRPKAGHWCTWTSSQAPAWPRGRPSDQHVSWKQTHHWDKNVGRMTPSRGQISSRETTRSCVGVCGKTLDCQQKLIRVKVKCCIYIAPFSYEYAPCSKAHNSDQFTPSGPKAHIGASGSRFNVCWYSFYRPRKDGKLSELQREWRSHRNSTLDEAGDWTWGLRVGRQRCYHCANPSAVVEGVVEGDQTPREITDVSSVSRWAVSVKWAITLSEPYAFWAGGWEKPCVLTWQREGRWRRGRAVSGPWWPLLSWWLSTRRRVRCCCVRASRSRTGRTPPPGYPASGSGFPVGGQIVWRAEQKHERIP